MNKQINKDDFYEFCGSSILNIDFTNITAFQSNEYIYVIREEEEEKLKKIWEEDSFFGEK